MLPKEAWSIRLIEDAVAVRDLPQAALGLMEQRSYYEKVQRKTELAREAGIRLVTLTAADLDRLPEIFAPWLPADREDPARRAPVRED
ncbi:hypothetical protein ACFYXM_02515 [Streptomyces sp. NPDC002476]|uniref:hypothetical protein n=1 Tax=Streptomyces sp. NPDC002476 TaxID=3364648 RepID=UPI0036A69149